MSFIDGLLPASWRGIPFFVKQISTRLGRRIVVHEYPFRDQIWVEDLGRGIRAFGFRGFMAGNLASIQRDAMLLAMEKPGPGTLSHPTLGIFTCALVAFTSVESDEHLGVYVLEMEFIETGSVEYPDATDATGDQIDLGSLNVLSASASDFASSVIGPLGQGAAVLAQLQTTLEAWVSLPLSLADDASSIVGSVAGLGDIFGRYLGGAGAAPAPAGTSPVTLIAANIEARQAVGTAVTDALATPSNGDPSAIVAAVQAVAIAARAVSVSPLDQVRILTAMGTFSPAPIGSGGDLGISPQALPGLFSPALIGDGGNIGVARQVVQDATAAMCRRVAMAGLANACVAYLPPSFDEAVALRQRVLDFLGAEVTIAGAGADDASGAALRRLSAAVFAHLTARGADLARLRTMRLGVTLPALVVGQRLYQNGMRARELIRRVDPIHPAFMPPTMTVLAF